VKVKPFMNLGLRKRAFTGVKQASQGLGKNLLSEDLMDLTYNEP
jgi:hypothetical protein